MSLILSREVGVMLLLAAIGVYARKTGMLTTNTAKRLSDLIVTVVMPVFLVNTLQRDKIPELMPGFWLSLILSSALFAATVLVSTLLFRHDNEYNKTARIAAVLPNTGFMGIPLLLATTGEASLIYCAAFQGPVQILIWAWAIPLLNGERPKLKKLIANPAVIAFTLGIFLLVTEFRLPALLNSFMGQLSGLNTPLSMIMLGVFLADVKPAELLKSGLALRAALTRNLLYPIAVVLLIWALNLNGAYGKLFAISFTILYACPCGSSIVMLPARAGLDGVFPSKTMAASAVLSIITIPLVVLLANILL